MFVMLPPFGKTRLHFPILKPDKRFIHHLRIMRKPKPVHNPNRLITCKIDRFSDNQLITAFYLRRIFASRHGNQRRNRHRCNPPYFSCIHTNLHCFLLLLSLMIFPSFSVIKAAACRSCVINKYAHCVSFCSRFKS